MADTLMKKSLVFALDLARTSINGRPEITRNIFYGEPVDW